MLFYIAGRPQTIVSLLKIGRFPDKLPSFVEPKELVLFSDYREAIVSIKVPNINQLFLVEVEITSKEGFIVPCSPKDKMVIQTSNISTNDIKSIILNSKTAENLLLKLLNNEVHVPIKLDPDLFVNNRSQTITKDLPSIDFCPSFGDLPPLKSQVESNVKIIEKGDILNSNMQTIINTVNCVGVMGKGLALAFKQAYPEMFKDYKKKCDQKEVKIGRPYLFKISDSRWILNFPTKDDWRRDSKIEYVEAGLKYLAENYNSLGITSLAVPPLGCGHGGLDWEAEVFPLVKQYLLDLNIPMEAYIPFVKPSMSAKPAVKPVVFTREVTDRATKKERLITSTQESSAKPTLRG